VELTVRDDLVLIRLGERFDISTYSEFSSVISKPLQPTIQRIFLDFGPTIHFDSSSLPMLFYLRHKVENREITLVNFNDSMLDNVESQNLQQFFRILDHGSKEITVQWSQDITLISPTSHFNQTVKSNFFSVSEHKQNDGVRHYFIDFSNTKWYDDESVPMLFQFRSKLKQQEKITLIDFEVSLLRDLNIEEFRMFFQVLKRNQENAGTISEKTLRSIAKSETITQQTELTAAQLE